MSLFVIGSFFAGLIAANTALTTAAADVSARTQSIIEISDFDVLRNENAKTSFNISFSLLQNKLEWEGVDILKSIEELWEIEQRYDNLLSDGFAGLSEEEFSEKQKATIIKIQEKLSKKFLKTQTHLSDNLEETFVNAIIATEAKGNKHAVCLLADDFDMFSSAIKEASEKLMEVNFKLDNNLSDASSLLVEFFAANSFYKEKNENIIKNC